MMEFLVNTDDTRGTLESVRWPCKPIILSAGHFEGSTAEVQLNSWLKTSSL